MYDRLELFYPTHVSSDRNYFHQSHQKSQLAGYVALRKKISLWHLGVLNIKLSTLTEETLDLLKLHTS